MKLVFLNYFVLGFAWILFCNVECAESYNYCRDCFSNEESKRCEIQYSVGYKSIESILVTHPFLVSNLLHVYKQTFNQTFVKDMKQWKEGDDVCGTCCAPNGDSCKFNDQLKMCKTLESEKHNKIDVALEKRFLFAESILPVCKKYEDLVKASIEKPTIEEIEEEIKSQKLMSKRKFSFSKIKSAKKEDDPPAEEGGEAKEGDKKEGDAKEAGDSKEEGKEEGGAKGKKMTKEEVESKKKVLKGMENIIINNVGLPQSGFFANYCDLADKIIEDTYTDLIAKVGEEHPDFLTKYELESAKAKGKKKNSDKGKDDKAEGDSKEEGDSKPEGEDEKKGMKMSKAMRMQKWNRRHHHARNHSNKLGLLSRRVSKTRHGSRRHRQHKW